MNLSLSLISIIHYKVFIVLLSSYIYLFLLYLLFTIRFIMLFRHNRLWKKALRKITALVGEMMLSYAYDMLYCCIVYLTLMICCIGVLFIIIWCILLISIICGTSKNNLKAEYVPESIPSMASWKNTKVRVT